MITDQFSIDRNTPLLTIKDFNVPSHMKVFVRGNVSFNNWHRAQVCPFCNGPINAKSVHQHDGDICVECLIHVCAWNRTTGNCMFPNCKCFYEKVLSFSESERSKYCAQDWHIKMWKKDYNLWYSL